MQVAGTIRVRVQALRKVTIEFDDGKQKGFPAGKAFLEAVNTWHNAKNLGDTPVKMLVVFFGEKGKKNMIGP